MAVGGTVVGIAVGGTSVGGAGTSVAFVVAVGVAGALVGLGLGVGGLLVLAWEVPSWAKAQLLP